MRFNLIIILFFLAIRIHAQVAQLTVNNTVTNSDRVARDEVKLTDGAIISATGTAQSRIYTDKNIVLPATYSGTPSINATTGDLDRDLDKNLALGSTQTTFEVTPTGALSYVIPIAMPKGINNMQPSLSVAYNSMAGNGIAGFGWNISGISSITKTAKNKYYDNEISPIDFNDDVYSLDNNRLFKYYQSGSEIRWHTNQENYAKITSFRHVNGEGPSQFVVETKDGLILKYGTDENSIATPVFYPTNKKVLACLLSTVTDKNGNKIEYIYNHYQGETVIGKINYTSNTNAGIAATNSISFYYDNREDYTEGFFGGSLIGQVKILREIEVFSEGTRYRDYKFIYSKDNFVSKLIEVQESNSNNEKLNSILFNYETVPNQSSGVFLQTTINPTTSGYLKYYPLDYNGDGIKDLVVFSGTISGQSIIWNSFKLYKGTGNTQFNPIGSNVNLPSGFAPNEAIWAIKLGQNSLTLQTSDYNGDGFEDLMLTSLNSASFGNYAIDYGDLNVIIYLAKTDGTGFESSPVGTSGKYNLDSKLAPTNKSCLFIADFDGDKKTDVFNFYNIKAMELTVPPNLIFDHYQYTLTYNAGSNITLDCDHFDFSKAAVMDENADGLAEIVGIENNSNNSWYKFCYVNGSFQFVQIDDHDYAGIQKPYANYYQVSSSSGYCSTLIPDFNLYGDFNGDGVTDILTPNASYASNWAIYLMNGRGNVGGVQENLTMENPYTNDNQCKLRYYCLDINGDGFSDVVEIKITDFNYSLINIFYSNGTEFHKETHTINYFELYNDKYEINFGDYNADGTQDILIGSLFYTTGDKPYIYFINRTTNDHFLKEALSSLNVSTKFEIKKGSYTKTANQTDVNLVNTHFPIPVVTKVTTADGKGGNSITTYSYKDAIIHKTGLGFIGFKDVTAINNINGLTSISHYDYHTSLYTLEKITSFAKITATAELIAESTQEINVFGIGGTRMQVLPGNTSSTNYKTNQHQQISYTYDTDLGNVLVKITQNGNQTVTTTYSDFVTSGSWIESKPTLITSVSSYNETGANTDISRTTNYTYDIFTGNISEEKVFAGTAGEVSKTYSYTSFGAVATEIVNGASCIPVQNTYEYDNKGRFITKITNTLQQSQEVSYNKLLGVPLTSKSVNGLITKSTYDNWGRPLVVTAPDNTTINYSYGWVANGDITGSHPLDVSAAFSYEQVQTQGKPAVKNYYDIFGRLVLTETDGLANKIYQAVEYNSKGQVYKQTGNYELVAGSAYKAIITTITYDDYNRIETSKSKDSDTQEELITNYSYSINSQGHYITNALLPDGVSHKITEVDEGGILLRTTDEGGTVSYTYYADLKAKATQANSITTTIEYDDYGHQKTLIDPNSGTTHYTYNAYGQLTAQTDANNATYNNTYDELGRTKTSMGPDGTYTYTYYDNGTNINLLQAVQGPNGITTSYTYDNLNRLKQSEENVGSENFITSYNYDANNRLVKKTYPGGFALKYEYTDKGYLNKVKQNSNGQLIWQCDNMSPLGSVDKYTLGNGLQTQKTYTNFGYLTNKYTPGIQNDTYSWTTNTGNLFSRTNTLTGISETFTYDAAKALTTSDIGNGTPITIDYDPTRNHTILSKTGIGTYAYNPANVNAVEAVSNNNGDINAAVEQDVIYTSFNKPQEITEGDNDLIYTYGPDQQRRKAEMYNQGALQYTRYYQGDYEKTIAGSTVNEVHYISAGGSLVAMYVKENGTGTLHYVYTDHLGSITTVTRINPATNQHETEVQQSFDAWGRYRDPATWELLPLTGTGTNPAWLYRGYTGHEHLDAFALINMNARLYDPALGLVLSPDNFISEPDNPINYNRYAYCNNNPLKYTDPSGNVTGVEDLIAIVAGGAINVALHWGQISTSATPWKDGLIAFGIGAIAGEVALYTGGATLAAMGGGVGAIAVSAALGSAYGLGVMGVGNHAYFHDPLPTTRDFVSTMVVSAAIAVTLYYAVPAAIYVYDRYTAPDLNPMPVRTIGLEVADDVPAIYNTSGEVTIAPAAYEQAVPVPNKTITKIDGREVVKLKSIESDGVYHVTPDGVALPKGTEIPNKFIENPNRGGSYGLMENGKFVEKVRIDPATPINMKGPNESHFHLDGGKEHIFDITRWPWR